jgi:TRIAP1/MDM35 family protein
MSLKVLMFADIYQCHRDWQLLSSVPMADSLSPECTPLKSKYDTCFNAWFEGYLEPAVAVSSSERSAYSKEKADEFEAKCGKVWGQYRACVQVRVPSVSPQCSR